MFPIQRRRRQRTRKKEKKRASDLHPCTSLTVVKYFTCFQRHVIRSVIFEDGFDSFQLLNGLEARGFWQSFIGYKGKLLACVTAGDKRLPSVVAFVDDVQSPCSSKPAALERKLIFWLVHWQFVVFEPPRKVFEE